MTDVTAPRGARPTRRPRSSGGRRVRRGPTASRTVRFCLGPGLLRAVRGATVNVERHVPELNALNVYPVPDGDTGVNMIATMRAALAEVETMPRGRATLGDLAAAIAFGALMGARGNSGVILSQVFRGMAESIAGKRRADARDLAEALMAGTRTAYSAVAQPVEGTILTVVREAAHAAAESAERGEPLGTVLAVATDAARRAVERTPEQLDVLRQAGVVDAGGQGLYRALEGALGAITMAELRTTERPARREVPVEAEPGVGRAPALSFPEAPDGTWGYETVFLLRGNEPLQVETMRRRLEEIGSSVLVAGDERMVKVHVHHERPDEVIALGLSLGSLSQVSIQNLDEQTRETREAGSVVPVSPARAEATLTSPQGPHAAPGRPPAPAAAGTASLAVVAIAAGDGLADVFASFGIEEVLRTPPTGNPSTGEILEALRRVEAPAIIVLPNDANIVLAAEQAARACPDKEVVVVPTRSAPEGFAALLAMDRTAGAGANLGPMLAAARDVQTLLVGMAERPSRFAGRIVRPGQFVVLRPDEGVIEAADDPVTAIGEAIGRLAPGFELVTLYLGDGATIDEAQAIARTVAERRPGTEVEILAGGQPHYRYLVSAE